MIGYINMKIVIAEWERKIARDYPSGVTGVELVVHNCTI